MNAHRVAWFDGERPTDSGGTVYVKPEREPICTCPWPHDELARREWPHVPLSLARAYADEYVRTGRRP